MNKNRFKPVFPHKVFSLFLFFAVILGIASQQVFAESCGNEFHNAGQDCKGCHGNKFSVAGTIYLDKGVSIPLEGALIKITDAMGVKASLYSNRVGNFRLYENMTPPLQVSVAYQGRELFMNAKAAYGGCNNDGCHIPAAGKPGKVFIPARDYSLTGSVMEAGVDTGEISYDKDIKPIFDTKCVICHKSNGARSVSPLASYADVTAPAMLTPGSADSLLIQKLDKGSQLGTMWPYLNDAKQLQTIRDWIVNQNCLELSTSNVGGPVPDAEVKLKQGRIVKYQGYTNRNGNFILKKVKAGDYNVAISKKGYDTSTQTFRMDPNNRTTLDLSLKKR
ncbi:MAG: carboxypeptidase regulatory-like domain-containing protein [Nitrospinae bacterium]|nr:carboxypeptidase regulatory-like domain-containing protein [Nitrospinota bacterium]